jgi:hypothetical protein
MPKNLILEDIVTTNHLVPLTFYAADVTDAPGTAAASLGGNEYVMPWAGSVVGISVAHNADLTGGVITWNPTVNGTAKTALGTTTSDPTQRNSARVDTGVVNFTRGQRLGVKWTKTGTVAPETTDVTITLWVMVEDTEANKWGGKPPLIAIQEKP